MGTQTHLTLSWGISKGRDTAGYNIRRLRDDSTGKRYRCNGGGYDMTGTVFADWLCDVHQGALVTLARSVVADVKAGIDRQEYKGLYGMTSDNPVTRVHIDGACGMSSVVRIAEAAGLSVQRVYGRTGGGEVAIVVTEA